MVCLFPQNTLGSCCDDFDEEKEEEQRYGMPGLTPASEQSFDFDDHAYAAAPGSHGGSVDGENAFVPPRCVFFVVLFFLYDKTRARGRCISSFWRRRVREGEDREPATRTTTRRSFARILRATRAEKRQMQLESRSSSFFLYVRFCRAFFCALLRRATRDVEKIRRRRRRHAISLFDGTKNRYRAFSKYNDKPGTGKTGYFDIPPNNYPFYMEEEK